MEQEQLCTERDEKLSRFQDASSPVRWLVLDCTLGEGRLEELVSELQLLYKNSREVPVSAGSSFPAAEYSPRVHEWRS